MPQLSPPSASFCTEKRGRGVVLCGWLVLHVWAAAEAAGHPPRLVIKKMSQLCSEKLQFGAFCALLTSSNTMFSTWSEGLLSDTCSCDLLCTQSISEALFSTYSTAKQRAARPCFGFSCSVKSPFYQSYEVALKRSTSGGRGEMFPCLRCGLRRCAELVGGGKKEPQQGSDNGNALIVNINSIFFS